MRIKVTTVEKPCIETDFKAGDLVSHASLGKGVIVGFSDISGNPLIFFYKEQENICIAIKEITIY